MASLCSVQCICHNKYSYLFGSSVVYVTSLLCWHRSDELSALLWHLLDLLVVPVPVAPNTRKSRSGDCLDQIDEILNSTHILCTKLQVSVMSNQLALRSLVQATKFNSLDTIKINLLRNGLLSNLHHRVWTSDAAVPDEASTASSAPNTQAESESRSSSNPEPSRLSPRAQIHEIWKQRKASQKLRRDTEANKSAFGAAQSSTDAGEHAAEPEESPDRSSADLPR